MHKSYEALHYLRYTVAKGTGLLLHTNTETTRTQLYEAYEFYQNL